MTKSRNRNENRKSGKTKQSSNDLKNTFCSMIIPYKSYLIRVGHIEDDQAFNNLANPKKWSRESKRSLSSFFTYMQAPSPDSTTPLAAQSFYQDWFGGTELNLYRSTEVTEADFTWDCIVREFVHKDNEYVDSFTIAVITDPTDTKILSVPFNID